MPRRSLDPSASDLSWAAADRVERDLEREPGLHRPRGIISAEARHERMLLAAGSAFVADPDPDDEDPRRAAYEGACDFEGDGRRDERGVA